MSRIQSCNAFSVFKNTSCGRVAMLECRGCASNCDVLLWYARIADQIVAVSDFHSVMLTKAARYGTTDGTSLRDERIDRFKAQIRHHILTLNDVVVLSRGSMPEPWLFAQDSHV